jgi:putative endonuclease
MRTSRVANKPYFLYVLWSSSAARFYIGISDSVAHRMKQHNSAGPQGWTSRYKPWTLVHSEQFDNYTDARRRELELKRQKGGKGFFAKTGLDPSDFGRRS